MFTHLVFPWRRHTLDLVKITVPLSLSQLSEMAMNVTDTVLLGGLGAAALAVGGMTTSLFFSAFVTFQAALGGASILIARSIGQARAQGKAVESLSDIVTTALILGLILCLPVFALLLPATELFEYFNESALIVHDGSRFMHILLCALVPNLAIVGLMRIILPALGSERLLLWTMPGMALFNALLNALLIYGWHGIPGLGLWGSAIATVVTGWSVAIFLIVLVRREASLRLHFRFTRVKKAILVEMLRLGLPMMVSAGAEIFAFQLTGLYAGSLGETSAAAHQVALSVAGLVFMVNLALSQAVNIRVAYWLGARDCRNAKRAVQTAFTLTFLYSATVASLLFFGAQPIARLYVPASPDSAGGVIPLAASLLKVVGIFQILDGIQVIGTGALRGCRDTLVPMFLIVGVYGPVAIFGGNWLAFHWHLGVQGLWYGLAAGLGVIAVLLTIRLVRVFSRRISEVSHLATQLSD